MLSSTPLQVAWFELVKEKGNSLSRIAVVLKNKKKLAQSFSGNASRKAKGSGMGLFVVKSLLEHEKLPYHFEMQDDHLTFFMSYPKVAQD